MLADCRDGSSASFPPPRHVRSGPNSELHLLRLTRLGIEANAVLSPACSPLARKNKFLAELIPGACIRSYLVRQPRSSRASSIAAFDDGARRGVPSYRTSRWSAWTRSGLRHWPRALRKRRSPVTGKSSARGRRAACWPTGCRPIRATACCCSRPAARTTGSGSTFPSAISSPSAIRAPTGCSRPSPVPGLNGRALNYPRGKVIGGSLGDQRHDLHARPGGRLRRLAPARPYRLGLGRRAAATSSSHEDHFVGASDASRGGGEWRVEHPRMRWELLDAFRDAADRPASRRIDDFNTGDNEGSGYFQVNQKAGRRWSAARGFLKPVLSRANLRLETGCLVEARDVRRPARRRRALPRRTARRESARCRGEVILAAGAIGSTQAAAALRRRPGRAAARARHSDRCSTSRASARTCRIICSCA